MSTSKTILAKCFLGVDTGGSKTHALVAGLNGEALGFGRAGSGNYESVSYDGVTQAIGDAVDEALLMAGLEKDALCAAGFGIAGYDWPSERQPTVQVIQTLGLNCPFELVNDAVIGLLAGASREWGLVVNAGSGNNVRGVDREGREGRITGEGLMFGEFGGAGELVMKALHGVSHEWTKRGPETALTSAFIQLVGAKNIEDLLEGLSIAKYELNSQAAQLVFQIAVQGDEVAQEVIAWSARELGQSAVGVIRQLNLEKETFEVIMVGSLFIGGELFIKPLRETIQAEAPGAQLVRLEVPPVVGAVLLASKVSGLDPKTIRNNLVD
ncbi:MAG: BadF/BadG/BcrA/BcrD ATPase family protein, partial [Chloroflexota bacterium]